MAAATLDQLLVHDLIRSHLDLLLTWAGTRLLSRSPIVLIDGPLSVSWGKLTLLTRALAGTVSKGGGQRKRLHVVLESVSVASD